MIESLNVLVRLLIAVKKCTSYGKTMGTYPDCYYILVLASDFGEVDIETVKGLNITVIEMAAFGTAAVVQCSIEN